MDRFMMRMTITLRRNENLSESVMVDTTRTKGNDNRMLDKRNTLSTRDTIREESDFSPKSVGS